MLLLGGDWPRQTFLVLSLMGARKSRKNCPKLEPCSTQDATINSRAQDAFREALCILGRNSSCTAIQTAHTTSRATQGTELQRNSPLPQSCKSCRPPGAATASPCGARGASSSRPSKCTSQCRGPPVTGSRFPVGGERGLPWGQGLTKKGREGLERRQQREQDRRESSSRKQGAGGREGRGQNDEGGARSGQGKDS